MQPFEIMQANLRALLEAFVGAAGRGEIRREPGIELLASGVDFSMFNFALLAAPVADGGELDRRIATAALHFRNLGLPWSFWACRDWFAAEARREELETAERYGLRLIAELPGMAAEHLLPARRPLPALEFRRVADEPARLAFTGLMSVAFGVPLPAAREVYNSERFWRGRLVGYLGLADGQPVTAAATLVEAGVVGVYCVATHPSCERRGYAETIVRYALEEAFRTGGIRRTMLQSSPDGYALYEQMGYLPIARYRVHAAL